MFHGKIHLVRFPGLRPISPRLVAAVIPLPGLVFAGALLRCPLDGHVGTVAEHHVRRLELLCPIMNKITRVKTLSNSNVINE